MRLQGEYRLLVKLKFQSAPGLEAGRCALLRRAIALHRKFQSAPGLEAGRCYEFLLAADDIREFQSAPGLEAGRCADRARRVCAKALCFNPRPALRPGDARLAVATPTSRQRVSIRARP